MCFENMRFFRVHAERLLVTKRDTPGRSTVLPARFGCMSSNDCARTRTAGQECSKKKKIEGKKKKKTQITGWRFLRTPWGDYRKTARAEPAESVGLLRAWDGETGGKVDLPPSKGKVPVPSRVCVAMAEERGAVIGVGKGDPRMRRERSLGGAVVLIIADKRT
ncbi:hypothetical protein B0H17DRAFT_1148601 [Mycena rosella]|uniref:Uncharacterized protein n=1 Tax=Mycena rosella TaxID=1033263 RepID=A0AAD7C9T2_MYCRO|nr:hypothetical protein B0H17DRAFT_1148601 [Mycena rosella]